MCIRDRVGIGVTSFHDSSTRLQLQSSGSDHTGIVITAAAASTLAYLYMGDTDDKDIGRLVYDNSTNAMQMWTNNSERMRIDSSGLVNIGSGSNASGLSPLLHLHKAASSATAYFHITNADTGITNNDGFLIGFNSSLDALIFNKESTPLRFATAGTERMRIDSSGRVHIGTATNRLGETLHVLGQGIITSSAEDTNMMLFGTFGSSTALIGAFNNIPVVFRQNNTERMRIDTSGNTKFNSGFGSVTTVYGCRAWVKLNQTGTQSISGSGGVSSITDLGTGHTQINFATTMPDVNYAMVGGAQQASDPNFNFCFSLCMQGRNTGNANFLYRPNATSDTKQDNSQVDVAFFR